MLFLSSKLRALTQVEIHIRENLLYLSCKVRGKSVHKRNILETILLFLSIKVRALVRDTVLLRDILLFLSSEIKAEIHISENFVTSIH